MRHLPIRCLALAAAMTFLACGGGGGSSTPPPAPSTAPTLSGVNPTHGAPGATVALAGTNLLGATAVSFNGRAAFSFKVVSASEIDAVVPGSATTGPVRVTTPAGFTTSPSFTVDLALAPTLTAFTPTALTAGTVVTLTGTHFVGTSQVQFNGTLAADFTVTSDTEIQATAPSGLTAGTLSVTTPGGTATSASSYSVNSSIQVLMNTGFEQASPVIWKGDTGIIQGASTGSTGVVPHSGTQYAWLGGYGSVQSDQITQDLYIPATAQAANATFYLKIITAEPTGGGVKDSVIVEALNTYGTSLGTLLTKTNLNAADYTAYTVDLLPYKGQVIRLSFKSQEDAQNATSFLLDDVVANLAAPAADLKPIISSFTPTSGLAGEGVIQVSGMNFFGLTGMTIGGAGATIALTDGTSLAAAIPANAAIGNAPITISNAQGTGASTTNFSVTYGVPVVTGVNPTQGPIGTPVVIAGSYLGYPGTTLTLNGQTIQPTSLSPSQLTFTVPAGATSGNLVITTPGGTSTQTFTVNTASTTLDLHVENVQLTQSTQDLYGSVPIVAGKDGLIRAFVLANQANTATPSVKISVMDNNAVPVPGYPKVVAATRSGVPTSLDESSLASSWNLAVPGTDLTLIIQGVYLISAEIDPGGLIPEADKTNNAQVRSFSGIAVPTFRTTIFPVALSTGTGNITEANKGAWVARLAQMYPVAGVDVTVGATFTSSVTLKDDGTGWDTLLSDLTAKHLLDGTSDRYYFGALNVSYTSGVAGVGYVPPDPTTPFKYRTAIGWDKTGYQDGGNFPEVFAHETGHNMGRQHSPCGSAANPDPNYPYAGGLIGVWGYDTTAGLLKAPTTYKDIMGYCSPDWVSDYVYKKILDFRGATGGFLTVGTGEAPLPKAQAREQAAAQECLIVRGIVHDNGEVEILPSFRTRALPSTAAKTGEYALECVDQKNVAVFTAPIELMELGCWPKGHESHFVMALPIDATTLDTIAGLRVMKGGKTLASLGATAGVALSPEVQRLSEDKVQLTWDATLHPAALVRDADTGEVIAILSGGRQTFTTRAKRFDLALSRGATGRRPQIKVLD
ncbi:IPT/TIG domain-containing protein [Geothrix fuzhouensis]|uniref:IPT/TIG domain-containing protein n=1 Tax=Geothrix fuzhouensis TaxID=2966451 RepID=UPI0021486F13|nr:IPT/TIG domain-containing protein [Geothrix fuzhouensis]